MRTQLETAPVEPVLDPMTSRADAWNRAAEILAEAEWLLDNQPPKTGAPWDTEIYEVWMERVRLKREQATLLWRFAER